MKTERKLCQIGTTSKGLPCLVNINTLAGLVEPCEVCRPHIQKARDMMGWVPFRERFWMSNKLADFQHDALLDRIATASEGQRKELAERNGSTHEERRAAGRLSEWEARRNSVFNEQEGG